MASSDRDELRNIGSQLAQYVRQQGGNPPSAGALQGVVADLAAKMPDLQAPLRDLVTRQTFQTLLPHALSAGGSVRRDALIQEISRVYNADILLEVEEVLNGFLDASGGIAISITQYNSTYESLNLNNRPANATRDSIKPAKASNASTTTPSSSVATLPYREKLKPIEKWILVAAGTVAACAAITSFVNSSSGSSCTQVTEKLQTLTSESREFKSLINTNKEECTNDPRFLLQHAILDVTEGQQERAVQLLNKSVAIDPDNSESYAWLGIAHNKAGEYEKALSSYNRALEINPKDSASTTQKGGTLSLLGRDKEAVLWYSKGIQLDPSDSEAYRGRAESKGLVLKEYSAGLADINKAIQLDPSDGYKFKVRAYIKTWLDDNAGACTDIKKSKQLGLNEVYEGDKKFPIEEKVKEICRLG